MKESKYVGVRMIKRDYSGAKMKPSSFKKNASTQKLIPTISLILLARESLNDNCAPDAVSGIGFIAQRLFSLFRHCFIRYDLGILSTTIESS